MHFNEVSRNVFGRFCQQGSSVPVPKFQNSEYCWESYLYYRPIVFTTKVPQTAFRYISIFTGENVRVSGAKVTMELYNNIIYGTVELLEPQDKWV